MAWFQISAAALLASMIIFLSINRSEQLQSSKGQTLLRIQNLLNNPSVLSSWNSTTDFCNMNPSLYSTVVCYNDSITQLHVIGNNGRSLLPKNFSIESLFTTLVSLPSLKVLTLSSLGLWGALPRKIARLSSLEILNVSSNYLYDSIPGELSSLSRLQSLVLDDNMFSGDLPGWIGTSFPSLVVLSMRKNMFNGTLPDSIGELENLRVLQLSHNYFHGEVPGLARLTNLQVLDLEDNEFGTEFPDLGNKLVTLVLSKNKFRDGLPHEISSFRQLQKLDVSSNNFVGPFPPLLLALPSISHLNIAANKLTGMLFENQSCSDELEFVDLSSNFLTGHLPNCLLLLQQQKKTVLLSNGNCLDARDGQNPVSYCRNEALAVGVIPQMKSSSKGRSNAAAVIALGVIGGVIGGIALVALAFLLVKKVKCGNLGLERRSTRTILEDASTGYPSKLLQDARYISQTMKLGTVGLPAYRAFSLEEIEAATNNFESSAFIGESSQGQMYKGKLKDGSSVAIRCVKMKRSHGTQTFTHQIERISKLRHRHLFLHTGIVPGVSGNNLKITDVVLDQNLISKIRSYNLPLLADITGQIKPDAHRNSSAGSTQETKADVLDFGIILLEIIVGRPLESRIEVDAVKDQLQAVVAVDGTARRGMVDRDVRRGCSNQSLKTTMEICLRCLSKNPGDRPSFEDVLWNLQFAAQAQSGEVSPSSPFNII
ncbi:Probable inactive leucine-rich repeat receptor-like protein kinase At3g03770 [Linum perenne]